MRTIGLLGGMSWESSAEYYRLANALVRERLGGLHSARCILYSVDFAEIEELQTAGPLGGGRRRARRRPPRRWRPAVPTCSCSAPTRCTRSPTRSQAAISIPLLHLADTTADAVRAAGLSDGRAAGHGVHDGAGLLP